MMPVNQHMVNTSLLALPAAVAFTKKLMQDRKAPTHTGSETEQIGEFEQSAKVVTKTLKSIIGYQHHGIND